MKKILLQWIFYLVFWYRINVRGGSFRDIHRVLVRKGFTFSTSPIPGGYQIKYVSSWLRINFKLTKGG